MAEERCYSELQHYATFEERFRYLKLFGRVGDITFGADRDLNQLFYGSYEWKQVRRFVILRDESCDLGIPGYEIHSGLHIHHLQPITVEDVKNREPWILDPEFLITTTHQTHMAIHYGDERQLPRLFVERTPGDTDPW